MIKVRSLRLSLIPRIYLLWIIVGYKTQKIITMLIVNYHVS